MNKIISVLGFIVLSSAAFADRIDYPFYGVGQCHIETNPCANGQPISCSASGAYSGNCSLKVTDSIWTVTYTAYGNGIHTVTQSCAKPKE